MSEIIEGFEPSNKIKLLPCPFCGGEAEIVTEKSRVGQVGRVECVKCSCKKTVLKAPNYEGDIEKDITDSWNTRKPMERIVERLEEAEKHCLKMHDWTGHTSICQAIEIVMEGGGIDE